MKMLHNPDQTRPPNTPAVRLPVEALIFAVREENIRLFFFFLPGAEHPSPPYPPVPTWAETARPLVFFPLCAKPVRPLNSAPRDDHPEGEKSD